jgi:hypothetical protein
MNEPHPLERPPYAWAALTVAAVLVLYVLTLAPTTQFWDASEYMTAAHGLGIPHPPGNPLFVLLAHVWGLMPLASDYGARINLFAATTSAVSAGLWFLIAERWLQPVVAPLLPRRLAALAGAFVGATAFTVWNQSVVSEKVYTVSLLSITLALWLAIRWADRPAGERPDRLLVLIGYLMVLTSANHQMGLLAIPAILVLVARTDLGILVRPRFLALLLGVTVFALTAYLFLPIRAQFDPYLNQGEVTTWPALMDHLTRAQFGKPSVVERQADLVAQLGMWWQYFTWQWGHDLPARFAAVLATGFGALGLLGAWRHWKADRRQASVMTTLMLTLTLALIFYLNFRYGFSQYPERQLAREVRERDYFFLAAFSAWGVWVGMGLATLMQWLQEGLTRSVPAPQRRWAMATPVLLLALLPLVTNHGTASRRDETMARDFARDMLQSVDPYAIIVTAGDNDTFPLWYAQEVEGVRRDVTVLVTSLAGTNWYLQQLQRRALPTFDPGSAPELYRDREWPRPTDTWMSRYYLTGPGDSLPPYIRVEGPASGNLGPIGVTLDPERLPVPGALLRSDLAVLQIVKDQLGRRPLYFSTTTGNYPEQLGLGPYLVSEGMVRRVQPGLVAASDSIVFSQVQRRWVNVPRTTRLAFDVYHGTTAARRRPHGWVDAASQNILLPYIVVYDTVAEIQHERNPALAARALELARATLANTTYQFDATLALPPPSR